MFGAVLSTWHQPNFNSISPTSTASAQLQQHQPKFSSITRTWQNEAARHSMVARPCALLRSTQDQTRTVRHMPRDCRWVTVASVRVTVVQRAWRGPCTTRATSRIGSSATLAAVAECSRWPSPRALHRACSLVQYSYSNPTVPLQ